MSWNPFARGKREERPVVAPVSREEVDGRAGALQRALTLGGAALPADDVAVARKLLARVAERSRLGGDHTVVALAGATGSGKSSLFNLLVGEPVSRIGARRPTTSRASAAIWGESVPGELLDWLDVSARHQVHPSMPRYAELDGLVLLDLPDFDSRVREHRAEADRVLEMCDLFVWVTDPQKYADAVLHEQYVRQLAVAKATSVVVLNQVDRLTPEAAQSCLADLTRLLEEDGLTDAVVLPTSTIATGGGELLIDALADLVQSKNASDRRLAGDLRHQAQRLNSHVGAVRPQRVTGSNDELVSALADSAGVNVALDAVERDYRVEAARRTGWPFTRWTQNLKAKPLSRLGLDTQAEANLSRADRRIALGKSSLPPASPAARAAVDLATRRLGERASDGMPAPWADEVRAAATPRDGSMADALDQAVMRTPLRGRFPAWWGVAAVLQWIFAAVALAGAVWLLVLFGFSMMQIHVGVPTLGGDWLPIPLVMLVVGLLLGFLLALLARSLARAGAARARDDARERLYAAITEVAQERIVAPVAAVVTRHDDTAKALAQASE
ncbi:GTPase family protein [Dermacoccus sp. Tok2021]|uniref:GTPase family protein n=1 Tax=Dermacoccus sp. Tok2021 TaxID=2826873 RepID=UPI001CA6A019|nr:GTPase [Dermacoccus sp. Tok2021]MBZ4496946.1 50S ribosome-binding GTPase [Dermacoccus sp. Tok2021]